MKDYPALSDQELQSLSVSGDTGAENELAVRYSRLVKICARPYFLVGGDSEDLMQEGMFGLLSAIREYDPNAEASFKTFAEFCIKRRLISAVRSASRLKHAPLNDRVSLEEIFSEETQTRPVYYGEAFLRSPEDQVLARECGNDFITTNSRYLSAFETDILRYYLGGLTYSEIAEKCGRTPKSVDNAVQRIRHKLARHLHYGDHS